MHFLEGDNSFGQMNTEEKNINLLKVNEIKKFSGAIVQRIKTRFIKNCIRSFN